MGFFGADGRWHWIGVRLYIVAGAIGLGAVYQLWHRVPDREVAMTVFPGAICAGLGWLAFRQRDRILYGTPATRTDWIVRGVALAAAIGVVLVICFGRGAPSAHQEEMTTVYAPSADPNLVVAHVWTKLASGERGCLLNTIRLDQVDPRKLCGEDALPPLQVDAILRERREACPPGHWVTVPDGPPGEPAETTEICQP